MVLALFTAEQKNVRWSSKSQTKKCKAVEQKNARWSSKKMKGGGAKAKQKM
jgi:hypothetical protein